MTIEDKLAHVMREVEEAVAHQKRSVRLVAVSKTKPVEDIHKVYNCGLKTFGQNYVQELEQKHALLPQDIQWHFIGHLQSNKIKKLLSVPNLAVIETVDRQSQTFPSTQAG